MTTAQQITTNEWLTGDKLTPDQAWEILCNADDRTSPEEYPDHALITREELAGFMERAIQPVAQQQYCNTCGAPLNPED